jgi:general secretion pathway protein G
MKLRCPYCRRVFVFEKQSTCPSCGKVLVVPERARQLLGLKAPKRTVTGERRRERLLAAEEGSGFGRKPATIAFMLVFMVVIAGLLLGRLHYVSPSPTRRMRVAKAERELMALRIALERYRRDCGGYPSSGQGLRALVRSPRTAGWQGPYITYLIPDPWRNHYHYEFEGDGMTVRCMGPDGALGTPDDLLPEEPTEKEIAREGDG